MEISPLLPAGARSKVTFLPGGSGSMSGNESSLPTLPSLPVAPGLGQKHAPWAETSRTSPTHSRVPARHLASHFVGVRSAARWATSLLGQSSTTGASDTCIDLARMPPTSFRHLCREITKMCWSFSNKFEQQTPQTSGLSLHAMNILRGFEIARSGRPSAHLDHLARVRFPSIGQAIGRLSTQYIPAPAAHRGALH